MRKDLSFPGYFGENWDAFEECLRDLSWLSAGQIVLDHEDVPLADDVASAKTYVAILADATRKMAMSDRPLVVKFPVGFRDQISGSFGCNSVQLYSAASLAARPRFGFPAFFSTGARNFPV